MAALADLRTILRHFRKWPTTGGLQSPQRAYILSEVRSTSCGPGSLASPVTSDQPLNPLLLCFSIAER